MLFYYGLVASLLDLSGSVQEGDDLGAGADGVRGERRGGGAVGHALFDRPVDGGRVVGVSAHVGEDGLCRGGGAAGKGQSPPHGGNDAGGRLRHDRRRYQQRQAGRGIGKIPGVRRTDNAGEAFHP